jgi:hypothetical protein
VDTYLGRFRGVENGARMGRETVAVVRSIACGVDRCLRRSSFGVIVLSIGILKRRCCFMFFYILVNRRPIFEMEAHVERTIKRSKRIHKSKDVHVN